MTVLYSQGVDQDKKAVVFQLNEKLLAWVALQLPQSIQSLVSYPAHSRQAPK